MPNKEIVIVLSLHTTFGVTYGPFPLAPGVTRLLW